MAVFGTGGVGTFLTGVDLVCRPDLVVMGGVLMTVGVDGIGGDVRPPTTPRLVRILVWLLADVVGVG